MNPFRTIMGDVLYDHIYYRIHHRQQMRRNGVPRGKAEGERRYLERWRPLSPLVDPYSYRLYSRYCGPTPDIIPFDLLRNVVEPCLNPPELWLEYEDKNRFAEYVDPSLLPVSVASRRGGGPVVYSFPLQTISYPLILKPSIDRSCGDGIMRFDRVGERYISTEGVELSDSWLQSYGSDFVLQRCLVQHPFMARLCSTAVCTIRLAVYRSVVDGLAHVTAAVLRVGPEGAVVDNIVAGGRFVGIDVTTGTLADTFFARFGQRSSVWNGVDLGREHLVVPNWDAVIALAVHVADAIKDHHLLALDIAMTEEEKPMLIEYNIGGFSSYMFHFTGQTVFGPYTEEVIRWVQARS